jgi:tetratricopeptide (TPR) repeat protein
MRAFVPVLILFALLLPSPPHLAAERIPSYQALVDAYRRDGEPQVREILATPRGTIATAVAAALAPAAGLTWEETRAAAMLHSEAALSALNAKDAGAADFHLDLAQRFLDRTVSLRPPQQDFAWRWYEAVPRLVRQLGDPALAARLVHYWEAQATGIVARTKYRNGLAIESRGAREIRTEGPGITGSFVRSGMEARWLVPAAREYEEALKEDPSLLAAALHLGRVRMLQGQRPAAAALFQSALSDVDPVVGYLAALFLGSIQERAGRFTAAEAQYRDAVARVPTGQSAPLALAEVLSRTGRESEAREALAARLLKPGTTVVEPMWVYGPPDEEPGTRFDLLRMEVRR